MKLSAPIHRLKRNARLMAREDGISLSEALDRIASQEGYVRWSLLAAKASGRTPAEALYETLSPGDLLLIGARPGQGKTLMSLRLALEAMKASHRAMFFTLEYNQRDVLDRLRVLGVEPAGLQELFRFDSSDEIDAGYIMRALASAPRGTLAVIDYLQLLDQKREKPELMVQVRALKRFAEERGLILVFISQIDRSYDPSAKPFPDLDDIRLPNPLDLALFDKTCFLNGGEARLGATRAWRGPSAI